MMRFALGSTAVPKRSALLNALWNAFGTHDGFAGCLNVPSGIREQPVGLGETFRGARNRAAATKSRMPEDVFCVGIESGILMANDGTSDFAIDVACVVILCPNGKVIRTTSTGIPFNMLAVAKAGQDGFDKTTVGRVMADFGMVENHADPHNSLTRQRFPRTDLISQALEAAFSMLEPEDPSLG